MGEKIVTVTCKKKRPKKTSYDLEKLHQKQIDIMEKFHAVYKLPPAMKVLWDVVFRSGELIAGQIRLLKERTGERWNYYLYWKRRRVLEKELRRGG